MNMPCSLTLERGSRMETPSITRSEAECKLNSETVVEGTCARRPARATIERPEATRYSTMTSYVLADNAGASPTRDLLDACLLSFEGEDAMLPSAVTAAARSAKKKERLRL